MFLVKRFGIGVKNLAVRTTKELTKPLIYGVIGAGIYYTYESRVGGFTCVKGGSMVPTFNNHLVNTSWNKEEFKHAAEKGRYHPTGYHSHMEDIVYYERDFTLSRGDVVILKDPSRKNKLIKRVVGLPGDIVTPLGPNKEEREPITLGDGQVWVESDHAGYGYRDSSLFGPVNTDLIEAKVTRFIGRFPFLWPRDVESVIPETAVNRVKLAETVKH